MWTLPRTVLVLDAYLKDRSVGRYGFTKRVVTVGRHPLSDLRLDHPGISRTHFRIWRDGAKFVLEDCRSANGTFVNRQRVRAHTLHQDDEVEAGKYMLRVSLREECEYDGGAPELEHALGAGLQELPTVRAPHLKAGPATTSDDD